MTFKLIKSGIPLVICVGPICWAHLFAKSSVISGSRTDLKSCYISNLEDNTCGVIMNFIMNRFGTSVAFCMLNQLHLCFVLPLKSKLFTAYILFYTYGVHSCGCV